MITPNKFIPLDGSILSKLEIIVNEYPEEVSFSDALADLLTNQQQPLSKATMPALTGADAAPSGPISAQFSKLCPTIRAERWYASSVKSPH